MLRYKGLLLDIDNTLYSHDEAHSVAMNLIINYFKKQFNIDKKTFISCYENARNKTHIDLNGTAASHNRLIYFQKMCEALEINSLKYSLKIYNLYIDNYLQSIKLYDGVYNLLNKYKNKICFLTDLTAEAQFRKISKLKLNKYCNKIVTSEEAGNEKPHSYMFMLALHKLKLKNHDICMIGDNFNKDIIGANNLKIKSIWLNYEKKLIIFLRIAILRKSIILIKYWN